MPDIRVLLLLVAWAPGAVLAQAAAPEPLLVPPLVAAPEEPAFTPGPPPEAVEAAQPRTRPYSLSPARLGVEVLGGAAGGVVVTLATLIIINSSDVDRLNCRDGDVCDNRLIGMLGILGCGLGSTASVYASGELMGGQGRFLPTMLTGVAMGAAGAGLYYGGVEDTVEVVIPLMVLPMVSSIVAYEVSAALRDDGPSRESTVSRFSGVTWAPALAVTPRGGTLGLAGRF